MQARVWSKRTVPHELSLPHRRTAFAPTDRMKTAISGSEQESEIKQMHREALGIPVLVFLTAARGDSRCSREPPVRAATAEEMFTSGVASPHHLQPSLEPDCFQRLSVSEHSAGAIHVGSESLVALSCGS